MKKHKILITENDFFERNRRQQVYVQNEKLATIGILTAGIAHEINNPLSYVLTNVELLSDCIAQINPENLAEKKVWMEKSLKQIKEGVNRVKVIASDLKVFSRSHDAEKDMIIDLESILTSSINMAAHEIKYRAKIVRNFGKISAVKVHEGRLGQVFLNLLMNAAQATPEENGNGNEIRITTLMHSGRVVIDIQDTGTGMSPEVIKQLFTPFFTTKAAGFGTGLGLSICQNIIRGFGGEITVESQVGYGTTFRVSLPVAKESIDKTPIILCQQIPEAPQRGRILLIDDEPCLAQIYGAVLSQDNEVVVMTNGRRAFELLLKDSNFDVIFSDLSMPDMSGMDIFTGLQQLGCGVEEKIVFMTGGAFTQKAQDFLKSVPNKIVEKPIEVKALCKLAQEFIQKKIV
jgi:two-component system, cell cycle sensor histidine kinase and response regulator CckA